MNFILFFPGFLILIFFLYALIVSWREKEKKAAIKIFISGIFISSPLLIASFLSIPIIENSANAYLLFLFLTALILLIPIDLSKKTVNSKPLERIDERTIMFSRNLLSRDKDRLEEYYVEFPEHKPLDDSFRKEPGLLSRDSALHNLYHFASAEASFAAVETFNQLVESGSSADKKGVESSKVSEYIKGWAVKLGAHSAGICSLKDYHKYSKVGRGEHYGDDVQLDHKYAIAVTVEMDKYQLDHAPLGPTVMESAQQYLNAGAIAVQIAEFIRRLGYEARAHIDGNYRIVCPLIAKDAGLGEIGRMGLLMTPKLGPRVRIAVVTTELELIPDKPFSDSSTLDFCTICKKCADICPSNAIPQADMGEVNGIKRWQINSEKCFTYWCKVGTDCGRCVAVCPYSHPDNSLHNIVRYGIKHNFLFRKAAVVLDDMIYSKKPKTKSVEGWQNIE